MKKVFLKVWFSVLAIILSAPAAKAVCPVCTVAVGAGLEGARLLGVDDVMTGVWAGGLTVSLIVWTASYLRKRGLTAKIWDVLNFVFYYGILALLYVFPIGNPVIKFSQSCLWTVDQFLLGVAVGSLVFWLMSRWYLKIKARNGGHAKYPFQKVVMPFGGLLVATFAFWLILHGLPIIGISVC